MVVRLPEPEYMPVMLEWNDLHVMQNGCQLGQARYSSGLSCSKETA